jgi:succinoglycan biosynthesis protein ExoA
MPHHVSVIVPALNEARHIQACVRSILAQETDAEVEVLVIDGGSTDGTADVARAAGATVVDNPDRVIPAALNRGLESACGEIVLRFDGHSEMPPAYIAASLRALEEVDGAGSVGGWCEVRASGPWGTALGEALASPLGIGYPLRWRRPPPGAPRMMVDTVHFGCYSRDVLRELGGWREDILTNEDFELDYRLRQAGYKIVFDPAIWATYRPRESFGEIARQYFRYGRWKAEMLAGAPASVRPRQLAPPALLAALAGAALPTPLRTPARAAVAAYAVLIAVAAARSESGWRLAALLPAIHLSWGAGLITHLPGASARRR